MQLTIGSIESSDLLIEISDENQAFQINNLVPEIDNKLVEDTVVNCLKEFDLMKYNPKVYYNGANQWVIMARCEAGALAVTENVK